ncbi:MAG: fibronectin type III domain-containing protein [Flavobacteriales bacterium]|nr:fibronectin type III domain-containing protein [Flavobacteriales bacterium]
MATAKMGLDGLSATEIVAKAQGVHDMLAASAATFPAPVPSLATFQDHIDALAAANAAVDANGGKADHLLKKKALQLVKADVKTQAAYVQAVSGGDADLINAGGFDVVKRGGPIGELNPPKNLGSRYTNMSGRVSISWDREDGTDLSHVFISSSNAPFKWELIGATTKSRFNADSLEPGTIYWFAVTAIGAAGETSKSEPLMARAA